MKAMVLKGIGKPLEYEDCPRPSPKKNEVLVKVHACAICRTDLHIIDGEVPAKLPLILGHQIVGSVEETGERVGIPWLASACGTCTYCKNGQENLCDKAQFTGKDINGGYAEYCTARSDFIFPLDSTLSDEALAPLLCAGMIGYRAYKMTGNAKRLGFYGFGAAAHLLIQLARYEKREVFAFTRPGDTEAQKRAKALGATWAGDSTQKPPELIDGAIVFAPVGALMPLALAASSKGSAIVSAGIHMSDIPSFPYELLWGERLLRSVANLTRQDGHEFLALAPKIPIKTSVKTYPLKKANEALSDLRDGRLDGSAVLIP